MSLSFSHSFVGKRERVNERMIFICSYYALTFRIKYREKKTHTFRMSEFFVLFYEFGNQWKLVPKQSNTDTLVK